MTPSARLAAAIGILDAWQDGAAAEALLTRWARGARYAGSKDRAAVRDIVYDILRKKGSAAALGGGPDGRSLAIGWLRLQGEDPSDVFGHGGHGPGALSQDERQRLGEAPAQPMPDCDIPAWLRDPLGAQAGDRDALFAAMAGRAPLWLRVALKRGSREAAIRALKGDGIDASASDLCPTALLVTSNPRRVRHSSAYLDGLVEIQDLSAQRAVASVDWPASGAILDYCAGGGGKALAIADWTAAAVLAHDSAEQRMADLPARAARAGVDIRRLAPGEASQHGPYAAVLCDVPCSGSGTWRRDPEAKWRLTPERLRTLQDSQATILSDAAGLVTSEGTLVYMTCSLLPAENEAQIERFLSAFPGWRMKSSTLDTPLTASDGFFTAILARVG